uniref:Uncharacterized protein n=1 Tax=Nicotiana tabacum TaxID=4097 RepID=A0A1S3ZPR0_TOBAC|nr:PREDICTED: uncharacterized protein LOC107789119 [Nicotiana tabacum]
MKSVGKEFFLPRCAFMMSTPISKQGLARSKCWTDSWLAVSCCCKHLPRTRSRCQTQTLVAELLVELINGRRGRAAFSAAVLVSLLLYTVTFILESIVFGHFKLVFLYQSS